MTTLTTPKLAIPYPDGAERVMDGDNAMGAIATKIDGLGLPFAIAAGVVAITLSNAAGGSIAVTFPVGRFTSNPVVFASCAAGSQNYFAGTGAGSTTGTTAVVAHRDSGLASITLSVCWWAIQVLPGAGPG